MFQIRNKVLIRNCCWGLSEPFLVTWEAFSHSGFLASEAAFPTTTISYNIVFGRFPLYCACGKGNAVNTFSLPTNC